MYVVWDDIMTNPLVIPNYMHASEADVLAHEENDNHLRQELRTTGAEPSHRDVVMPQVNEAEDDDEEEEEDCKELDRPTFHDPRDPPNPPNDPSNPPSSTNPSIDIHTDTNPTNPNKNTQTNSTNP